MASALPNFHTATDNNQTDTDFSPNGSNPLSSSPSSNGEQPAAQHSPSNLPDQKLQNLDLPKPDLLNLDLNTLNEQFAEAEAKSLIQWGAHTFGDSLIMSTSFGIQSAVMLGLVTSVIPNIPVIWIDTGYLPAETYRFAQQLTERLSLNLKVYQSPLSPARMEALYGKLWEEGTVEAFNKYDNIRKVEPMQRALKELHATA